MDRDTKLKIARLAYKDILEVIEKWEDKSGFPIYAHWDECITVDDELFHGSELRGELSNGMD